MTIYVERDRDAEVTRFPTVIIYGGDQEADEAAGNQVTQYRMTLHVVGWAKPTAGRTVGEEVNALYAATVASLLADRTLGGTCIDITELDTEFELDRMKGHGPLGCFRTNFQVTYFTASGDPYTLSNP